MAVATFWTMQPASAGSIFEWMSRPVTAWISIRSPPWGYLVLSGWTEICGSPESFSERSLMASGLLFSMPMTPFAFGKSRSITRNPSISSSGRSSIRRWSLVR